MDNPEILATLETQDTGRRQTKQEKKQHKKLKTRGEHRCQQRVNSFFFLYVTRHVSHSQGVLDTTIHK